MISIWKLWYKENQDIVWKEIDCEKGDIFEITHSINPLLKMEIKNTWICLGSGHHFGLKLYFFLHVQMQYIVIEQWLQYTRFKQKKLHLKRVNRSKGLVPPKDMILFILQESCVSASGSSLLTSVQKFSTSFLSLVMHFKLKVKHMVEEILKLKGKAVEAFLKYDSRKLTDKEQKRIKEARKYYLSHCKDSI